MPPKKIFEPEEKEWIRVVSSDLARWLNAAGKTPDFLTAAIQSWYRAFPYRHPRYARHTPSSESQQGLTFYGEEFFMVKERLRHQLNLAKDPDFKHGKSLPAGSMSGLVEFHEAADHVAKRLKSQGYYHSGNASPYSRDEARDRLTEIAGTCLMTYPDSDFGCYTNAERRQALLDLPSDLEDILQVLARHTGAELYAIASWRMGSDSFVFYDTCSPGSLGLLEAPEHVNQLRMNFLEYQREYNVWRQAQRAQDAAPAVYGAFDGSYRPLLPRHNGPHTELMQLLQSYFGYLWLWQGGQGAVAYEAREEVFHGKRIVDVERLPPGISHILQPSEMSQEEAVAWRNFICSGQQRALEDARVFRFELPDVVSSYDWYRDNIHSEARLRYGPASRLWVSRLMVKAAGDSLAADETTFQLPSLPLSYKYSPLTAPDLTEAKEWADECEPLIKLLDYLMDYELAGPVHARVGHWLSMWQTCTYFSATPPELDSGIEAIGGWEMPGEYGKERDPDGELSMRRFSQWLRSGIMSHKPSKTLLGGPYGWKWVLLILIRARKALKSFKGKRRASAAHAGKNAEEELEHVDADISWLIAEVESSGIALMCSREKELAPYAREDFKNTRFDHLDIYYQQHAQDVASDSDDPEVSPAKPKSILKSGRTKRNKPRTEVRVELPASSSKASRSSRKSPETESVPEVPMDEGQDAWEDEPGEASGSQDVDSDEILDENVSAGSSPGRRHRKQVGTRPSTPRSPQRMSRKRRRV